MMVLLMVAAALASPPDLERLLDRFDEMFESTGTYAELEIEVVKPEKTRTMALETWSQGEEKALIIITAPSRDAGTATLRVGRNLWNYLPRISRTIRVPPSMMLGSWMGTDLTNDDLVQESSVRDDYTAEIVGHQDDPAGWEVQLRVRPDVVGLWSRIDIIFSEADELPMVARYYDRKDRLARTMRFEELRDVGGRRVPTLLTVIPEREKGQETRVRYRRIDFDLDLDDRRFSLAELERSR